MAYVNLSVKMDTSKNGYPTTAKVLVAWILLSAEYVCGNLYTSLHGLRQLQAQSGKFAEKLDIYIQHEEERIDDLRRLSSGLREESHPGGLYDVEHPIGAFQLIHTWQAMAEVIQELESDDGEDSVPDVNESDVLGAASALLRLQRSYNLSAAELAQGRVRGHQAAPATPAQMEYIGVRALLEKDYGLAVLWFEQAVNATSDSKPRVKSRLLFHLARAHYFTGDYSTAVDIISDSLRLDPRNETIPVYLEHYTKKQASSPVAAVTAQTWDRGLNEERQAYEALCRGDRGRGLSPELYCRYRPTRIPYAYVKEEVLSVDPKIMILHEVIQDKDIERLKDLAKSRLHRGMVKSQQRDRFGNHETTEERVSKIGWVWDHEYLAEGRPVGHLSDLVGRYVGLSTKFFNILSHAEPFQVINYGLGGQYEPHVDYYGANMLHTIGTPYLEGTGDRMATFMFYLSDVTEGGGTVFPRINVAVPPVKGAAAFWYNVRKSGEMDIRTKHAGCPVLVGEKWVANKWIRERGQENFRPCGFSYEELD